jgi:transposase
MGGHFLAAGNSAFQSTCRTPSPPPACGGEEEAMAAKRTEMHRLQELVRLYRMGVGCHERARLLRMGPNTERFYRGTILSAGLLAGDAGAVPDLETLKQVVLEHAPPKTPQQQESACDPWCTRIEGLVDEGLTPKVIYDRLRLEDPSFTASRSSVKRMCRRILRERGPRPSDVAIPVETKPGEVAQVDFGYAGRLYDPDGGMLRRAWVFVMVLGHSRHMFARVVFDQTVETWVRLHVEAFEELGGVPETIVPDNLKAAVIHAAFGFDEETALNRSYRELARHYGFKIDPTPPHAPKKKGKVEAGVKYVKRSFFAGREGSDVHDVQRALDRWVREIAGQRIHGTTGSKPLEVFELEEKEALGPLPPRRFEPVLWKQATVHPDCLVVFGRRQYSVPWRHVGRKVWIRATPSSITVYADDVRVATHERHGPGSRSVMDDHLPAQRAALRHRSRSYWEARADGLGEDVGRFIREVFDSDDVLSQLRAVQAIVTHLETFPVERAQAAARRASYYGSYSYGAVKRILKHALDLEPLPTTRPLDAWADGGPRYGRDLAALARNCMEVNHGNQ